MSEQELLRQYEQRVAELQIQLADYQRILNLVGARDASVLPSQMEGPPQSAPATIAAAARPPATDTPGAGTARAGTRGAASPPGSQINPSVLDHLSDGFAQVHADGTLGYYNRAFAQLLSLPENISGELRLMDLEHLASCEPFAAALQAVLGGAPQYARCTLIDQHGRRRIVECAATAVPDGDQTFSAALVIRDQTEREQLLAHLTALNTVATALTRTLDFDERLSHALAACRDATAADAALIYLIDDDGQHLSLAHADGFSPESVAVLQQNRLRLGEGELAGVALDGEARAILDLQAAPLLYPEPIQHEQLVSGAFVALRDAHKVTGVLAVHTRSRRLFTAADIRLLTSMAGHVGLSLHNARLHEQLRRQAQHDSLTGLYNRGHLMELAEREYQRALRHRSPLIVLMIDVNQFKAVNDSSGHLAGDQALQAIARMLREQTRSFDLLGRYGGDEFVVLLVDCTHAYAFEVIRRLHQAAQAIQLGSDSSLTTLALSIGMAACRLKEGETLQQVLAEADLQMYAVKNGSVTGSFSLPAMG